MAISLWQSYRLGVRMVSRWPDSWSGRARELGGALRYPPKLVKWLTPIDFVRYREFEFAFEALRRFAPPLRRVLDISSPKLLPLSIAHQHPNAQVESVDIVSEEVELVGRATADLGLRNVHASVKDARALDYPDGHFDLVTSVSVFEHIAPEEDGDVAAARELSRVLAPGGIAVLTVPFAKRYFAEYVQGRVYERASEDTERIFFQRFYDRDRLEKTIIGPSGLEVAFLGFVEERFWSKDPRRRVAHRVNSSRVQNFVFGLLYYPLSQIFLTPPRDLEETEKPYIACLVLRKPPRTAT